MSKCGVRRIRKSNVWYWTLLRPKYWADAVDTPPAARNASARAARRVSDRIIEAPRWNRLEMVVITLDRMPAEYGSPRAEARGIAVPERMGDWQGIRAPAYVSIMGCGTPQSS